MIDFAVIYQFNVKQDMNEGFLEAWRELTQLIHRYEGGLGSRIHLAEEGVYIAYAQWPDKKTWKSAGDQIPQEEADRWRHQMRHCCSSIETLYELDLIEDLLAKEPYAGK